MKVGILGAGRIAATMAKTLNGMKEAQCYAVASRSLEKAEAFAQKNHVEKAYGSYEEMLSDENVEESLTAARLVKVSVEMIEEGLHVKLKPDSLSHNRLVSHVRYMIFRIMREEQVSLDLEDYAKESFPLSYSLAEEICARLERELKKKIRREEIGFLGIHIERVARM